MREGWKGAEKEREEWKVKTWKGSIGGAVTQLRNRMKRQ